MSGIGRVAKMAMPAASLILYYHPYSFYSQKVVMTLYEKNLKFDPILVDLINGEQYSSPYLKINPRGEVPVLQDDSKYIPDSARIIDYLEDNFSNGSPRLMPHGKNISKKAKAEIFRNAIDALPAGVITMGSFFHEQFCDTPKMPFLKPVRKMLKTGEINSAQNLRSNADINPEAKEILLKKAEFQDKKHLLVTDEDEYKKVLDSVEDVLNKVEEELSQHDSDDSMWLCSEEFTLADISLTILLVRLDTLGLDSYFWGGGKRKHIEKYYKRVQQKSSFKSSIPNYKTHLSIIFNANTSLGLSVGVLGAIGVIAGAAIILKKFIV